MPSSLKYSKAQRLKVQNISISLFYSRDIKLETYVMLLFSLWNGIPLVSRDSLHVLHRGQLTPGPLREAYDQATLELNPRLSTNALVPILKPATTFYIFSVIISKSLLSVEYWSHLDIRSKTFVVRYLITTQTIFLSSYYNIPKRARKRRRPRRPTTTKAFTPVSLGKGGARLGPLQGDQPL